VFNRISRYVPSRPQVRVVNPSTIQNLPTCYHTCGTRCIWIARRGSPHVSPVCPRCERFDLEKARDLDGKTINPPAERQK